MSKVLEHVGVKGMRWGVRRRKKGSKTNQDTNKTKHLTNDELKQVIDRIELERKFNTLTAKQQSKKSKFAEDILKNMANESFKLVFSQTALYGLEKALGKDAKDAAREAHKTLLKERAKEAAKKASSMPGFTMRDSDDGIIIDNYKDKIKNI